VNAHGVLNQLEVIRRYSPHTRWIGFGTIYEDTHETPYSATKRAMRETVETYRKTYGIYAVVAKLGFTESCLRPSTVISRKITRGVTRIAKAIKAGESFEPLQLRDIDERFSFTWAEDVADGVWRMLSQETFNPAMKDRAVKNWAAEYGCGEGDWSWHLAQQVRDYSLISPETASVRDFVELAFKEAFGIWGEWTLTGFVTNWCYDGCNPSTGIYKTLVTVSGSGAHESPIDTSATTDLDWQPQVSIPELIKRMMACEMEVR
jgi:GDPmannose 4,6-dehydratase